MSRKARTRHGFHRRKRFYDRLSITRKLTGGPDDLFGEPDECGDPVVKSASKPKVPAITHFPSHDCVGPGYSAIEMWHSPLVMWPSLLVVMTQDPLPAAHSLSLRAVFST